MVTGPWFSESKLARLRVVCQKDPRMAALYAFDLRQRGDYNLAALFSHTPPWPERLDLEVAVARALGLDGVELINLRRMPLISRFDVINRGEPIFVGDPERLAVFIEETIVRYSAFYPLLEALYWEVEASPSGAELFDRDE